MVYFPIHQWVRAFFPLLICALLLCSPGLSHGRDVVTIDRQGSHFLSQGAYFMEDPTGDLTIEDVIQSNLWQRNNRNSFVFGYTESVYWVSISIKVEDADRWYAIMNYPVLDHVDFYWVKHGKVVEHLRAGDRIAFSERPMNTREFVFSRDLHAGEEISFYVRVQTEGSYQIPIKLQSSQAFQESLSKFEFMLGMFYGVLFIMSVYNLVLYLITNVSSYLYYVIYVLTTLFSRMAYDGSGFAMLWPDNPDFNEWILPIGFQVSSLTYWIFSYKFLDVKHAHSSVRLLYGLVFAIMCINLVLLPFMDYTLNVQIQSIIAAVALVFALTLSMFLTVSGSWYAAVFCIATMLSSLAFVIAVMATMGKFDDPEFSIYGYAYARVFEIILFALALGVRIRHMNNLRLLAEEEAQTNRELSIKNLQQYQRLYENALTGNAVLTRNGTINSVNREFNKIMGEDSGFAHQERMDDYFEHSSVNEMLQSCRSVNDVAECEVQTKNGRWVSLLMHKVAMDEDHDYECTLLDISDRKESERIKEQAQKDKMVSLQKLVVGIANEINLPLKMVKNQADDSMSVLNTLSDALEKGNLTTEVFDQCVDQGNQELDQATQNVARLSEMIASFKKVSVQQLSYVSENLDIEALKAQIYRLVDESDLSLKLSLSNQYQGEFVTFPSAIQWIMSELIDNVVVHTDDHMRLELKCDIFLTAHHLYIAFVDNGGEISKPVLDKLFDPFFTTKSGDNKRLGLGLYQVYNLVTQLLKGEIKAESKEGLLISISIPNLMHDQSAKNAGDVHE